MVYPQTHPYPDPGSIDLQLSQSTLEGKENLVSLRRVLTGKVWFSLSPQFPILSDRASFFFSASLFSPNYLILICLGGISDPVLYLRTS